MRNTFLFSIMSLSLLSINSFGAPETWYKRQDITTIRQYAAAFDLNAIRELGNRGDTESIPFLKKLAGNIDIRKADMENETPDNISKIYGHTLTAKDKLRPYRGACFAARAALTKMKVTDYLGDFIVELSTTDRNWAYGIVRDLGYIGDARAVKYIGPLLFEDTCLPPSNPYGVCNSVSAAATVAMGEILHPAFMNVPMSNPHHRRKFFPKEWRQWWVEHRSEYGDSSALPSKATANSSDVSVLRKSGVIANLQASSDGGPIDLSLQWVPVQLPSANGMAATAGVLLALAPQNGPLWWTYSVLASSESSNALSEFADDYKLYLTTGALLAFQLTGNRVVVSAGRMRYQSTDAALSAVIPTLKENLANGASTPVLQTRSVDLWSVLGQGFFMAGGKVGNGGITSIARKNGQWVLILTGPNKDNAVLTLSPDYKVVSANLNGKAVYP